MRFDSGKGWPHPVLRPPEYGDDYPNAEFEVEIDCRRDKGGVAVEMTAEFALSDPDLLQLVEGGAAEYVVLVKSTKTHFRREFRSKEPLISSDFNGQLSGRVEISSFLVCVQRQASFKAEGWHPDFAERTFDLEPGVVLAEDKPKEYWIDAADEAPIGAIFEHRLGARQEGEWQCNLDGDRVQILLSDTDSNRFQHARESANNTPDAQYLMNGLYLPVLIHVLSAADGSRDAYEECRWFDSLNRRLEAVGCKELGDSSADRSVDAQKVLEYPFVKMPMMADADEES